jgi:hypothetical protein
VDFLGIVALLGYTSCFIAVGRLFAQRGFLPAFPASAPLATLILGLAHQISVPYLQALLPR